METGSIPLFVNHIGVIVKDLDKTIESLSALGIGPFERPVSQPIITKEQGGKAFDFQLRIMVAQLGTIGLELIQPIAGASIQKEFLDKRGEGLHHLGFRVDDIQKKTEELIQQGFTVIQSGRRANGTGFAYFDTGKEGGITMELFQR